MNHPCHYHRRHKTTHHHLHHRYHQIFSDDGMEIYKFWQESNFGFSLHDDQRSGRPF